MEKINFENALKMYLGLKEFCKEVYECAKCPFYSEDLDSCYMNTGNPCYWTDLEIEHKTFFVPK